MQYGRRAYGAHRTMTQAQQAANIAASLAQHPERTIEFYGEMSETLRQLVEQALAQMTEQYAA